jgi:hypothetical protein
MKIFKAVLLLAALLIASQNASAQTIVTGKITANTTWRPSSGVVVVKGLTFVNAGVTLTIEPGTIVKFFDSSSSLFVYGTILANGTTDRRITFTSLKDDSRGGDTDGDGTSTPTPGDWGRLYVNGNSASISFADFLYGGYGIRNQRDAALQLVSAQSHTVTDSTFRYNKNAGLYALNGSLQLMRCTFDQNAIGISTDNLVLTARNNLIAYNSRMGAYIFFSTFNRAASLMTDNTIAMNGEVGVFIYANPDNVPSSSLPTGERNNIYANNLNSTDPFPYQILSAFYIPNANWSNNFWARGTNGPTDGATVTWCPITIPGTNTQQMIVYSSTKDADCPKFPIGGLIYRFLLDGRMRCCARTDVNALPLGGAPF